jgi:hypothetical protein
MMFMFQGEVFQFRALPFGLKSAPWIFSMTVRELQILVHKKGIHLHQYLDDWVIQHEDPLILSDQLSFVLDLCHRMGFMINRAKSDLVPFQDVVFVGYRFVTTRALALPSEERVHNIVKLLTVFIQDNPLPAFLWQSM